MKELKPSRKTRYTQMVLQDTLLELMREKPIAKITIKELCEKADLNRTTFYAHYQDQYALLRHIEQETLAWAEKMIATLLEQTDRHETIKILESIFQYFVDNREHIQILMSETGDIDFQKQLFSTIYQRAGISPMGAAAEGVTKECYFVFVVNGSIGLIQHWLKGGLDTTAKEMAGTIYHLAFMAR